MRRVTSKFVPCLLTNEQWERRHQASFKLQNQLKENANCFSRSLLNHGGMDTTQKQSSNLPVEDSWPSSGQKSSASEVNYQENVYLILWFQRCCARKVHSTESMFYKSYSVMKLCLPLRLMVMVNVRHGQILSELQLVPMVSKYKIYIVGHKPDLVRVHACRDQSHLILLFFSRMSYIDVALSF